MITISKGSPNGPNAAAKPMGADAVDLATHGCTGPHGHKNEWKLSHEFGGTI